MRKVMIICLFAFLTLTGLQAQSEWSVKTNLPHLLTATPNVGVEYAFAQNYSVELSGGVNPFKFGDDAQLKHWIIWPEVRYWLKETYNGHFFGVHGLAGEFNVGGVKLPFKRLEPLENRRYDGKAIGAGVSYGYQWIIGNNLVLEVTAGLGAARLKYESYNLGEDGAKLGEGEKNYFGPTKGAIAIGYVV